MRCTYCGDLSRTKVCLLCLVDIQNSESKDFCAVMAEVEKEDEDELAG